MSTDTAQQVVTFRVGDDHFAADIGAVERILRYTAPAAVPNLPDWVEGVLDYQGRVVPVIDLRRRFGLRAEPASPGGEAPRADGRIVIFATGDDWIGAIVDAVLEVTRVRADEASPPPSLFRGLKAEYLRGLVRRDGRLIIHLEVGRLLTSTEQLALERALEEARDG
ncbi:MAG TPA: chemotaxis protein CheW [Gemmatimonadaceae bacterium]